MSKGMGFDAVKLMRKIEQSGTKNYPKPSEKIEKAKGRLIEKLNDLDQKITPSALKRIVASIHDRIARLALERVVVKKKITLFDNNETSAGTSKKISEFAKELKRSNNILYAHLNEVPATLKKHIISND
jgi:ABC-type Zn uptake system ZnuABC Zn-binding protein ZnuA